MHRQLTALLLAGSFTVVAGCANSESPEAATAATIDQPASEAAAEANSETAAKAESEPAKSGTAIGETGPAWEGLEGVDGEKHSLKDLADAKAVAVVFTCNTCPVAVDYEDRLKSLASDYQDKGVTLVAINVNNNEPNRLPAMKERAEEKGFNFAYLYDPSQQIARAYGATVTPHVFLLNQERKVDRKSVV